MKIYFSHVSDLAECVKCFDLLNNCFCSYLVLLLPTLPGLQIDGLVPVRNDGLGSGLNFLLLSKKLSLETKVMASCWSERFWNWSWRGCYWRRLCRWRLKCSSSFKIEFRTSASHPDLSSASRFFFYFRSNLLICQVLEMTFCRSSSRWRDVLVRWSLFSKFTLVIPASNWLRCTNRPLGIYPIRPSMPIPPRIPGPYPT